MLKFEVVSGGTLPRRATKFSAGFDVYARTGITIARGETRVVPLGFKLDASGLADELKNSVYAELYVRSSTGRDGLMLGNGVGVIDIDYPDEVGAILYNRTDSWITIEAGQRICQLVIKSHLGGLIVEAQSTDKERLGGFGSTDG